MKTTVVLPTYNEAKNIVGVSEALLALPLDLSLVIVDDNSPDGTGALADGLVAQYGARVRVLHRPRKNGLGRAYRAGFLLALEDGCEAVAQMDSDFSHAPHYLEAMSEILESGRTDVVIGSRYVPGGELDRRWSRWRVGLSAVANRYARLVLRLRVRDATAGYKLWRREVLEAIDLERVISNGYIFQVEMAYLTQKLGFRQEELPIYFEDRRIGRSKMDVPVKLEAVYRVVALLWKHRGIRRAAKRPANAPSSTV